jgi:hypothetical protein
LSLWILNAFNRAIITAVAFYVTADIRAAFTIGVDFTISCTIFAGLAGNILTDIRAICTIGVLFTLL